jgi:hypothetical protein
MIKEKKEKKQIKEENIKKNALSNSTTPKSSISFQKFFIDFLNCTAQSAHHEPEGYLEKILYFMNGTTEIPYIEEEKPDIDNVVDESLNKIETNPISFFLIHYRIYF